MPREVILKKTLAVAAIFAMSLAMFGGVRRRGSAVQRQRTAVEGSLGQDSRCRDNPLAGAVVYLTNTRTRAVKTYIAGKDGDYRFPGLTENTDYEVYAQYQGHKSETKSVSSLIPELLSASI